MNNLKIVDPKKVFLDQVQFSIFFNESGSIIDQRLFLKMLKDMGLDTNNALILPVNGTPNSSPYLIFQDSNIKIQISKLRIDMFFINLNLADYKDYEEHCNNIINKASNKILSNIETKRFGIVVDYVYQKKNIDRELKLLQPLYFNNPTFDKIDGFSSDIHKSELQDSFLIFTTYSIKSKHLSFKEKNQTLFFKKDLNFHHLDSFSIYEIQSLLSEYNLHKNLLLQDLNIN